MFYIRKNDAVKKLHTFNLVCETIIKTLKLTSKETSLKFYNAMDLSTLFYRSENSTLRKLQASRLQAAEIRFLRHVAGYCSAVSYTHLDVYKRQVRTST